MNKPLPQEGRSHANLTSITDDLGRTLPCYIEHTFELEGQTFGLLLPVHTPVDLVAWQETDDGEEEPMLASEDEIDEVFEVASEVLAKQDLLLQRTALVLTVVGEIPDLDDDDVAIAESEDDPDDYEELVFLDSFYYGEQEYSICMPLDPMLIVVRFNDQSQPELLSAEEFQQLEPILPSLESSLAERLFEDLD